jgi:hypothetical protein
LDLRTVERICRLAARVGTFSAPGRWIRPRKTDLDLRLWAHVNDNICVWGDGARAVLMVLERFLLPEENVGGDILRTTSLCTLLEELYFYTAS